MLLEKCCDLVRAPESLVDLAVLRLSYRGKLDWTNCVSYEICGESPVYGLGVTGLLFSLLSLVESIVLLSTLTAIPHASFNVQSSL